MRNIGLIILLSVSMLGFGQNEPSFAMVSRISDLEQRYEFPHNVDYFSALEERLFNYANRNEQVILELNIQGGKCVVLFNEMISDDLLNETLLFLAQGLSYTGFSLDTSND